MPKRRQQAFNAPDDQPLFVYKKDLSGGMNTRQYEQNIGDNQAVLLQNILLDTQGVIQIRKGLTRIDSNFPPNYLLDEAGEVLLDESNIPLLQEGTIT